MSDFALSGGFAVRGGRRLWLPEPLRQIIRALSDPYRPELHYMRGPGPKWREKHGVALAADAYALPPPRTR